MELIVCNSAGEIVLERRVMIHDGLATIPVGGLLAGMYFGRLIPGNGQAEEFMFLVGR